MPRKVARDVAVGVVESILTIAGLDVCVRYLRVPIGELAVDPENPRIRYLIKHSGRKKPTDQAGILEMVRAQPGYDDLQKQIRKAGGIHDALIVRDDGVVVEGNTRLAALLLLHNINREDPRWQRVPVIRLPKEIPNKAVEMLKANFHIGGKTMWRPAAQADQIYFLNHDCQYTIEQIADETRLSKGKVEQHLKAYEYLLNEVLPEVKTEDKVNRQAILESKFSHALEFMSRKSLESLRNEPGDRKRVAKLIAENKIQGAEVRKLAPLMENKKTSPILYEQGFKAASEALVKTDPTAGSKILKDMAAMTKLLKTMTQDDIHLFRKHAKARAILAQLKEGVDMMGSLALPAKGQRK